VGRMVATILGLDAIPRPDDAADALAIAIWSANTARPSDAGLRAGVLDRAAIAPIARGQTPYERAVAEALRTAGGAVRRAPVRRD
jgi:crossover junction endodeoxyribonuclease RuvC